MSENDQLNDYAKRLQDLGQLNNGPFMRPSELVDKHRGGFIPGGGVDISQFTVQRAQTAEEKIAETFKVLAQLVAALPKNENTDYAKRDLSGAASYIAQHFIDLALYPEGKPR